MAPTWMIVHNRHQTLSLKARNVPVIRYKTVNPVNNPNQFLKELLQKSKNYLNYFMIELLFPRGAKNSKKICIFCNFIVKHSYKIPHGCRADSCNLPVSRHSELLLIRVLCFPHTLNIHSQLFQICISENKCDWTGYLNRAKSHLSLPALQWG